MTGFTRFALILGLTALLVGCANSLPESAGLFNQGGVPVADFDAPPGDPALDASSAPDASEPVAALAEVETDSDSVAPGFLGITVASLGDPTDPGMWLETPYVSSEIPGQIISEYAQIVLLTLRPSGGAVGSGSRISLAAMQALGLSLTDLATVTVVAGQ